MISLTQRDLVGDPVCNEADHQDGCLEVQLQTASPAVRVGPASGNQSTVPSEQRFRVTAKRSIWAEGADGSAPPGAHDRPARRIVGSDGPFRIHRLI
jgi:hypothetical protein